MNRNVFISINPEMLKWARIADNMDIEYIARKYNKKNSKKAIEFITDLEKGTIKPTLSQMVKLAKIYRRSVSIFYLSQPPKVEFTTIEFRRLYKDKNKTLHPVSMYLIREVQNNISIVKEIDEEEGFNRNADIISNMKIDTDIDIHPLAKNIRELLKITIEHQIKCSNEYDALKLWRSAIENLEIFVFIVGNRPKSGIPLTEFRACAIYDKKYPVIVLNSKDSIRAKIFSLLHEFCHLLLKKSDIYEEEEKETDKIEQFCNKLASEILLPQSIVLKEYESLKQNFSLKDIINKLSIKYKISEEFVLNQINKYFIVSDYNQVKDEIRKNYEKASKVKKYYNVTPAKKCISSKGNAFVSTILKAFEKNMITSLDASKYLGLKNNHLKELAKYVHD